jgi:histidinol-phosphate phosphatase family protein
VTDLERPRQVVVLAGGRGTRLGHLTEDRPKPMVEFHGRPFVDYQLELFKSQGFERVVFLLGYHADVMMNHIGDGSRFGLDVTYDVTDAEDLTAFRLQHAAPLLEQRFLLVYCDNYWPMTFDHMWHTYCERGLPVQLVAYTNPDGYSRNGVEVAADGHVLRYDKTRSEPGLNAIEISYVIAHRDTLLAALPVEQALFEKAAYPVLADAGQLGAYLTEHRYYTIGDPDRLARTDEFLARRPAILLDRDGTLNERAPQATYITHPDQFRWLPGAREALRHLHGRGYRVIIVSNQAGVNRGVLTAADVDAVNAKMRTEAAAAGGNIDAIYYCPHDWEEGCACRKPRPGMLFQAQRDHLLDLTRTWFIGDDERDAQAARAAHCNPILVDDTTSLYDAVLTLEPL